MFVGEGVVILVPALLELPVEFVLIGVSVTIFGMQSGTFLKDRQTQLFLIGWLLVLLLHFSVFFNLSGVVRPWIPPGFNLHLLAARPALQLSSTPPTFPTFLLPLLLILPVPFLFKDLFQGLYCLSSEVGLF